MATMFRSTVALDYDRTRSSIPGFHTKPFAFPHVQKQPALQLLGCLVLIIGLYSILPWLFPTPRSGQLLGRWQLQSQIRNGSRVQMSGEYEFRSDYTTRKMTSTSGTRAGLWIIRAPIDATSAASATLPANTTIITSTYQFVDTLMHHISVQVKQVQQEAPTDTLWPGPGIYDITLINDNQLTLRIPDAEAGGWIVLECTRISGADSFSR
ncbi:MAG: hypothetical protein ABIV47_28020 [Roseiflexaceae bacterium]